MAGAPDALRPMPSRAAVSRLRSGLDAHVAAMSEDIHGDLADIGRALADHREDLALEVLCGHIDRLETFAEEVRRTVAGSLVEREAEAVIDAAVAVPTPPVTAADSASTAPRRAAGSADGRASAGVGAAARRGMVTACLVLAAVMAGLAQTAPAQDPLSAALTASEQALMAAQGASPGSPTSMAQLQARSADLHRVIAELDPHLLSDPAVRRRLEVLLADQHQALVLLARHTPVAVGLLIDLQRLAAGLDLRLPTPVVPSPSALSADPSLLPDTHLDDALEDRLPGGPIGTTAGELVTPTPTGPIEAPVPATPPGTVAEEAPPPGEAGQASTTADPPPAAEEPTDAPDSGAENPVVEEEGAPQDDGDASMPADIEALLEEEATVGVATGGVSDLPGLPGG